MFVFKFKNMKNGISWRVIDNIFTVQRQVAHNQGRLLGQEARYQDFPHLEQGVWFAGLFNLGVGLNICTSDLVVDLLPNWSLFKV